MVARPVWNALIPASQLPLERNVMLHAGPSLENTGSIPQPILNSAAVAAVFEGLAESFDEAERLIQTGRILLRPAQDYGVVTPLAAVVSASMLLQSVYDAHGGRVRVFSPINGGNGPAPRLGLRTESALEHLIWMNGAFAETFGMGIAEGIDLAAIAASAMLQGDDCHGRTVAGTRILIDELQQRAGDKFKGNRTFEFMVNSPSLFLNLWMAATKCALKAAEGVADSALVTAAGGNGREVGLQISGLPGRWFTTQSSPPIGKIDSSVSPARALSAIGDSAIVDAFGLGAMAIELAPEQQKALSEFLPRDFDNRREQLPIGRHFGLGELKIRLGLSCRHVAAHGSGPAIALGILDNEGELGRIGGGIYCMPPEPFLAAIRALETRH